ncbi:MAG: archaeosortase/exosortase family protein [Kiritimatiellia bacterium]
MPMPKRDSPDSVSRRVTLPGVPGFVSAGVALLLAAWIAVHFPRLAAGPNALIRLVLGTAFALFIFFRPKTGALKGDALAPCLSRRAALVPAGLSALGVIAGLVFDVRLLEWLGLLALVYFALAATLPRRFSRDLPAALLVLFWIHPVPSQFMFPLQAAAQKLSVNVSEWLLHMLNVRVWADGTVLRTGAMAFEVPSACSGMRVATTVFVMSLGLGLAARLKPWEIVVLVPLAIVQAVLLNVLRISAMVPLSGRFEDLESISFLHDSTAFVSAAGTLVIALEVGWYLSRKRRTETRRGELNPDWMEHLSDKPPFWRIITQNRWRIVAGLAAVTLGAGLVYKSRPYHRAHMLMPVAEALRDSGDSLRLERAEHLARVVRRMVPEDTSWVMSAIRIRLLRAMRGDADYESVLEEAETLDNIAGHQKVEREILKAYALMGMGRIKEAEGLIAALPRRTRENDPRAAMVLAEAAYHTDEPGKAARHVLTAARWGPNRKRIEALYPYLRYHRKWEAIRNTSFGGPFSGPSAAMSAAEAWINADESAKVADIALRAVSRWPRDHRVLVPLFIMAARRDNPAWEERFSEQLRRCVEVMEDAWELYGLAEMCFSLHRPDLAWKLWQRIEEISPGHPLLPWMAAEYGDRWFVFRKHFLGRKAMYSSETMNIMPYLELARLMPFWRELLKKIPLVEELGGYRTTDARKEFLKQAIERFGAMDEKGDMAAAMRKEYMLALEIAGDMEEVKRRAEKLASDPRVEPQKAAEALSAAYERKGRWIDVYETLRGYISRTQSSRFSLDALLRLARAERELGLRLCAKYTLERARDAFPGSLAAKAALAEILVEEGSAGRALALGLSSKALAPLKARALYKTGRYTRMKDFCDTAGITSPDLPRGVTEPLFLAPAEYSLFRHEFRVPSRKEFARHASVLRGNLETAEDSFFFKEFIPLWLAAWERVKDAASKPPANYYPIEEWLAAGRDRFEKAEALNNLTLLLCAAGASEQARNTAEKAADLFPESSELWHMAISLSKGDIEIISRARENCPSDGEIRLAALVTAEQGRPAEAPEEWSQPEKISLYTPAALTRAAEYLYRAGKRREAAPFAREAVGRADGLLAAYIIGIKCALAAEDRDMAFVSVRNAVRYSRRPFPILDRKLVELKTEGFNIQADSETIHALRRLSEAEPDEPLWPQLLGFASYRRGRGADMLHSLYAMRKAFRAGQYTPVACSVAAQACRRLGNTELAVEYLREGLRSNPGSVVLLNNLVFTLAGTEDGVPEALQLVPKLLSGAGDDLHVLDTAAETYFRAEEFKRASDVNNRLISRAPRDEALWFRAKVRAAEMLYGASKPGPAKAVLEEIMNNPSGAAPEDMRRAEALADKLKR